MGKRWFKHSKWPKVLTHLHSYTIGSFAMLMASGIALVNPTVHTVLIPYLPYIYQLHIMFGLVFAVTLITPFLRLVPKGKLIRRLDWLLPTVLGTVIVVTGVLIWLVTAFPTSWRSAGFLWHGRVSYILGAWIVVHAFYKASGYRPKADGINARMDPDRRAFLGWIGSGFAGATLLAVVDPFRLLSHLYRTSTAGSGVGSAGATDPLPQFPEYYTVTGQYPAMDLEKYRLIVDGLVAAPTMLDWNQIEKLDQLDQQSDFHCVTGWSVAKLRWTGIRLSTLAKLADPSPRSKYVNFYSFDGVYTESMKLSEVLDPSVLLAVRMDGQPLRREQGYPLRLVVPKMYGYKSIKWVQRVEFSDKPLVGYWEQRGYSTEAYIRNVL